MLNMNIRLENIEHYANSLTRSEQKFAHSMFSRTRRCDQQWLAFKLNLSLSTVKKKISSLVRKGIITIHKTTEYENGACVTRNTYEFFCDFDKQLKGKFGGILKGKIMHKKVRKLDYLKARFPRHLEHNLHPEFTPGNLHLPIYKNTKDKITKEEHSTICPFVSDFDSFKADEIKKITKQFDLDESFVKRIADNEEEYIESSQNIRNKRAYFKVSFRKECEKAKLYLSDGGRYFFADERKTYVETSVKSITAAKQEKTWQDAIEYARRKRICCGEYSITYYDPRFSLMINKMRNENLNHKDAYEAVFITN